MPACESRLERHVCADVERWDQVELLKHDPQSSAPEFRPRLVAHCGHICTVEQDVARICGFEPCDDMQ